MQPAYELKPWTREVLPHEDIIKGDFDLSSYAANLGQVECGADTCPKVYRDPVAFFQATYRTKALDELLGGVADVLAGGAGNRVLQLRTPFGGGKTHTLIALLHLFRSRGDLNAAGLLGPWKDPGPTRVVVLAGMDLNSASGRVVDGVTIRTLWGELAWRLGGKEAFQVVAEADERRVSPGGDVLRNLLKGQPTLILLDEVLTYVEAALGVEVGDTNLGRQTMLFLQHFTEVVRGLPHGAMVYSLQRSVREAVGDENLLEMLDSLVSRIDAKREPVTGDDVLKVVQRRLFQGIGSESVRHAVAQEYGGLLKDYLSRNAQSESERRAAAAQADALSQRILDSYPFHPELLDLMYLRWGSLPTYQRTRGALQFLATVVGALWKKPQAAGPLIGPGDVPLDDAQVRNTFFTQVGEREAMMSVLDSDLLGGQARCKRVDEAIAADAPGLRAYQVGTRLTRALALYSFGAKPGEDRGVLRSELLAATQAPGMTADVLETALQGLADTLLYIHGTGRRYRFEKRPNLNKLVDDEARKVEAGEVLDAVRKHLASKMGTRCGAVVWPKSSAEIPDRRTEFQMVLLGTAEALKPEDEVQRLCRQWTEDHGTTKREHRNALAFAVPSPGGVDGALAAARKWLALTNLLDDKDRHGFQKEDVDDLEARRQRAHNDLLAMVRPMYMQVLLPVAATGAEGDPIRMERFMVEGHLALGASGILDALVRPLEHYLFDKVLPGKLVQCVQLGAGVPEERGHWISGPDLVRQFFGSVQYPKLLRLAGLQETVADGVRRGTFGYVMGATVHGATIKLLNQDCLTIDRNTFDREDVDLSEGAFIVSPALAKVLQGVSDTPEPGGSATGTGATGVGEGAGTGGAGPGPGGGGGVGGATDELRVVNLQFLANGGQLFKSFMALQTLCDWADQKFAAQIHIHAEGSKPLDRNQYETAVVMSLEEEGVEVQKKGV